MPTFLKWASHTGRDTQLCFHVWGVSHEGETIHVEHLSGSGREWLQV